jgi:sugar-specific transcriptional regulator TrmB
MNIGERVETLIGLGLTLAQARVYLAMVQLGPSTAKELAKNTLITQQDIYRVTSTLMKTGIAEKLITKPISFKAIQAEQGITILKDRKIVEQQDLQRKTEQLLTHIRNNRADENEKTLKDEEAQFALVPGKESIIQRLGEALENIQTTLDTLTSKKRFSSAILTFAEGYQKAIERGVRIRICTDKHEPSKEALKIVRRLQKSGLFEVKYFPGSPEAIVSVFDKKEVYTCLSATASLKEASGIWSNNACFVAVAQSHFEAKWNSATQESDDSLRWP